MLDKLGTKKSTRLGTSKKDWETKKNYNRNIEVKPIEPARNNKKLGVLYMHRNEQRTINEIRNT